MQKCGILFTNHYGFAAPHGKRLFITVIIDKNAFAQLSNATHSQFIVILYVLVQVILLSSSMKSSPRSARSL